MGGGASKPENQVVEIDLANDNETNITKIHVVMRIESETKLMDSFLQIHEGTLVGVMIGVMVMTAISLILYCFSKCWCK